MHVKLQPVMLAAGASEAKGRIYGSGSRVQTQHMPCFYRARQLPHVIQNTQRFLMQCFYTFWRRWILYIFQ